MSILKEFNHIESQLKYMYKEVTEKNNDTFCLALLDIDDFKLVNDTFGHLAGDMVLKELSSIFQSNIRSQDIVARYGGEEFAIIFPETSINDARKICERIRNLVENHTFSIENKKVNITISGGVGEALSSETLTKQQGLVNYVDKLLYDAKNDGKNQIKYSNNTICMV